MAQIFEADENTQKDKDGTDRFTPTITGDATEFELNQGEKKKNTLYKIQDIDNNEFHTFDGRVFQRIGSSGDWRLPALELLQQ